MSKRIKKIDKLTDNYIDNEGVNRQVACEDHDEEEKGNEEDDFFSKLNHEKQIKSLLEKLKTNEHIIKSLKVEKEAIRAQCSEKDDIITSVRNENRNLENKVKGLWEKLEQKRCEEAQYNSYIDKLIEPLQNVNDITKKMSHFRKNTGYQKEKEVKDGHEGVKLNDNGKGKNKGHGLHGVFMMFLLLATFCFTVLRIVNHDAFIELLNLFLGFYNCIHSFCSNILCNLLLLWSKVISNGQNYKNS